MIILPNESTLIKGLEGLKRQAGGQQEEEEGESRAVFMEQ